MSKRNTVPTAFPTDSTPSKVYYFCIPDLPEWRELFIGHIMGLTYGYFWNKATGDFNEARNIMSNIVYSGLLGSANDCFCDSVANCIVNSDAVQDALDKQNSADSTGNNRENLTAGIDTNGCNNDNLFGATLELVNELNAYTVDTFEIIEAETNFIELIAEFIGAIPVAGDVIALIPNLLNFFQEIGAETYNASFTTVLRDEIACDLFCLYQENCELSLDDIFDYLWSEFSASAQPQTINEAINAFVAIGVIIDRVTVFGVFMIALAFIKLGDGNLPSIPFVNLPSTNRLRIALAVGATQPNNSWTVLCDPCDDTWTAEFFGGDGNITVPYTLSQSSSSGSCTPVYNSIDDRIDGCTPVSVTAVGFVLDASVAFDCTEIIAEFSYNKTRLGPSADTVEVSVNGGLISQSEGISGTGTGTRTVTLTVNDSVTDIQIDAGVRNNNTSDGSYMRLTKLTIAGSGINPF